MKVSEFSSYIEAECDACGERIIVARAEMSEAINKLFSGKAIVDMKLACPCQQCTEPAMNEASGLVSA